MLLLTVVVRKYKYWKFLKSLKRISFPKSPY